MFEVLQLLRLLICRKYSVIEKKKENCFLKCIKCCYFNEMYIVAGPESKKTCQNSLSTYLLQQFQGKSLYIWKPNKQ